jgi:hypothetical protein
MKIRFVRSVEIGGGESFEKGAVIETALVPGSYLRCWLATGHCAEEKDAPETALPPDIAEALQIKQ